tara:strand:- start:399 stop:731 length:333 start_codon:yes stop_codon:yes gene_type:complete
MIITGFFDSLKILSFIFGILFFYLSIRTYLEYNKSVKSITLNNDSISIFFNNTNGSHEDIPFGNVVLIESNQEVKLYDSSKGKYHELGSTNSLNKELLNILKTKVGYERR